MRRRIAYDHYDNGQSVKRTRRGLLTEVVKNYSRISTNPTQNLFLSSAKQTTTYTDYRQINRYRQFTTSGMSEQTNSNDNKTDDQTNTNSISTWDIAEDPSPLYRLDLYRHNKPVNTLTAIEIDSYHRELRESGNQALLYNALDEAKKTEFIRRRNDEIAAAKNAQQTEIDTRNTSEIRRIVNAEDRRDADNKKV